MTFWIEIHVSTRRESKFRQQEILWAASVRRDGLDVDHCVPACELHDPIFAQSSTQSPKATPSWPGRWIGSGEPARTCSHWLADEQAVAVTSQAAIPCRMPGIHVGVPREHRIDVWQGAADLRIRMGCRSGEPRSVAPPKSMRTSLSNCHSVPQQKKEAPTNRSLQHQPITNQGEREGAGSNYHVPGHFVALGKGCKLTLGTPPRWCSPKDRRWSRDHICRPLAETPATKGAESGWVGTVPQPLATPGSVWSGPWAVTDAPFDTLCDRS